MRAMLFCWRCCFIVTIFNDADASAYLFMACKMIAAAMMPFSMIFIAYALQSFLLIFLLFIYLMMPFALLPPC